MLRTWSAFPTERLKIGPDSVHVVRSVVHRAPRGDGALMPDNSLILREQKTNAAPPRSHAWTAPERPMSAACRLA